MTSTLSTPVRPAVGRLPFVVPLLALGTFLMCTSEYIVAGLLQEMAVDLDASLAQIGLLITAFAIGMIVGAPVMALATLRLPRRATLVVALIVFALGHAIAALSETFALVFIARVVTALATGAFWSVASVVATAAAGAGRSSRALGVMMSGVGLATVAGVPLGSFAGQLIGWRGTFWALAIVSLLAALVIRFLAPADGPLPTTSASDAIRSVATVPTGLLALGTILVTGAYMGTFSYISPLLTERTGLALSAVPLLLICFGGGAVIGTNLAGRLADHRPYATLLGASLGVVIVLIALVPLSDVLPATVILVVLLGVTGMAVPPVVTGLAVTFAPTASALAAAVAVAAFNAGTALATWLGGAALSSPVGVLGPTVLGVVLAMLGTLPLIALTRNRRRSV